jgi:hypothetical protein
LTGNGVDYSNSITTWFGTNQIAAGGASSANLWARGVRRGSDEVIVISGVDPDGRTWSTTLTVRLN